MNRLASRWLGGLLGFALGVGSMAIALSDTPAPGSALESTTTRTTPSVTTIPTTIFSKPAPPEYGVALAWSPSQLPDGIGPVIADLNGVTRVLTVEAGGLLISAAFDGSGVRRPTPEPDWLIPLETFAVGQDHQVSGLEDLRVGAGYLTETSAELRGIGSGGSLLLDDGNVIEIIGVVDDSILGAPELIIGADTAEQLGGFTPRFLLIEYRGLIGQLETWVRDAFGPDVPVRFRGPGETSYLRHGDAVLPQVIVKKVFGEFSISESRDNELRVDPGWFSDNIITTDLPIVGSVTCHRIIMPLLEDLLTRMAAENSEAVDSDGFQGCWNPRTVAGSPSISRHTWGIAVDINHTDNPTGTAAAMDDVLLAGFAGLGFTWGGDWLIPDPAHFEWVGQ